MERERDRETDRDRGRQTQTDRRTKTDIQTNRQRQTDKQTTVTLFHAQSTIAVISGRYRQTERQRQKYMERERVLLPS